MRDIRDDFTDGSFHDEACYEVGHVLDVFFDDVPYHLQEVIYSLACWIEEHYEEVRDEFDHVHQETVEGFFQHAIELLYDVHKLYYKVLEFFEFLRRRRERHHGERAHQFEQGYHEISEV